MFQRTGLRLSLWFVLSSKSLHCFLHHRLQRHMLLRGDAAAVFVFGSVVGDGPIHAGDLDPHIAPWRATRFPIGAPTLPLLFAPAHAQSRGLGERSTCASLLASSGLHKNSQQRARTVLLHLHRHAENIERAIFEQAIHHIAKNLRIQIVEIGFENRNRFLKTSWPQASTQRIRRSSAARHWDVPGKSRDAGAIARLFNLHLGERSKARGQRLHDRRAGRRDQFGLQSRRNKPARLSAIRPLPEREPGKFRARTLPFRRRR